MALEDTDPQWQRSRICLENTEQWLTAALRDIDLRDVIETPAGAGVDQARGPAFDLDDVTEGCERCGRQRSGAQGDLGERAAHPQMLNDRIRECKALKAGKKRRPEGFVRGAGSSGRQTENQYMRSRGTNGTPRPVTSLYPAAVGGKAAVDSEV